MYFLVYLDHLLVYQSPVQILRDGCSDVVVDLSNFFHVPISLFECHFQELDGGAPC